MADQTIVIALDSSEYAQHAVNWYVEKVHRPGNKIVFVHCIELPELKLNQARSLHMSPGVLAGMWKEEEQKTKQLEEKMKTLLEEKGIEGILRTATGKPGEVVVRVAEEEEAVLIVVGSRGLGKVRRTILGSVSDYLVNHAHCPVVVCRHPSTIKVRRPSGSDGKKSRHASGSDSEKSRHTSGESTGRSRHFSGEAIINALTRRKSSDKLKTSDKMKSLDKEKSLDEEPAKNRSKSVGSEDD